MKLYSHESSTPKWNAQRNLQGLTHYVDDDTLRFHKSKVISTYITDNGLLFVLIESASKDWENRSRGFRYVIFDVFGNVVGNRVKLDDMWSTSKAATKAMLAELNTLDAIAITKEAIDRQEKQFAREIEYARAELAKLQVKAA